VYTTHNTCLNPNTISFLVAHPDFPFRENVYRKRPVDYFAKIIPRYAGHRPNWTKTHGQTVGRYAGEAMVDFLASTRKKSKTLRQKTAPAAIFAMQDPIKPPPTVPLYPFGAAYIPGTTLYSPAARERFGAGFTTLTRESFAQPVPHIPAPLQNSADGKAIEHLTLPTSYMGYRPRALPFLCRHLDEQRSKDQERQRQLESYTQQQNAEEQAKQQQQQQQKQEEEQAAVGQGGGEATDYPEEMYMYLERAQGDDRFTEAVQQGADAYRKEKEEMGPEAALRVWEDYKAYLDMTFGK